MEITHTLAMMSRDDVSAVVPSDRTFISAVSLASASSSSCVSTCSFRVPFLFLGASCWRSCRRWFVLRVCSLVDLRTDLRTEGEEKKRPSMQICCLDNSFLSLSQNCIFLQRHVSLFYLKTPWACHTKHFINNQCFYNIELTQISCCETKNSKFIISK